MLVAVTVARARTTPRPTHDRRFLLGALGVALLLRFEGLLWPLKPDESGFLLVSRNWHPAADNMYGDYWVDRPPTLIALFRGSDLVGGPYAPRYVAAVLVLLLVYAGYRVGLVLGGQTVARWTAVAAVALSGQPDLEMWAAKSESLGVPFVLVSCWLSLEALYARPGRTRLLYAAASGLSGALAVGMKQNLVGGAVFGVVVLAMALRTRRLTFAEASRVAGAAIGGFGVPVLVVIAWALAAGVKLHTIWFTLYGFRGKAFSVITAGHMDAPMDRLHSLLILSVTTGIAVVLVWFLVGLRNGVKAHPEAAVAALVMLLIDIIGLLLSGSYWTPYLTALVPGVIVAVAITASTQEPRTRVGMQVAAALCAVSMVASTVTWTIRHFEGSIAPTAHYVGKAVAHAADPDDTIVVLYGRPDVVLASGLHASYEHLWSLPERTLDPKLDELRALIESPGGPTWVVAWSALNSWDIDHDGKLRALLDTTYVEVGEICGRHVLLRKGVTRRALPAVDCSKPWLPWAGAAAGDTRLRTSTTDHDGIEP
jgi:hypothetical protein